MRYACESPGCRLAYSISQHPFCPFRGSSTTLKSLRMSLPSIPRDPFFNRTTATNPGLRPHRPIRTWQTSLFLVSPKKSVTSSNQLVVTPSRLRSHTGIALLSDHAVHKALDVPTRSPRITAVRDIHRHHSHWIRPVPHLAPFVVATLCHSFTTKHNVTASHQRRTWEAPAE